MFVAHGIEKSKRAERLKHNADSVNVLQLTMCLMPIESTANHIPFILMRNHAVTVVGTTLFCMVAKNSFVCSGAKYHIKQGFE